MKDKHFLKKELKNTFESYLIHSFCLIIEALKHLGFMDLAIKQEEIKEETWKRLEK